MSDVISVAVIDDHPVIHTVLSEMVEDRLGYTFVGSASTAADGLELIKEKQPTIVVVDLSLKEGAGLDVIRAIDERDLDTRPLVYSVHRSTLHAEQVIRAGAFGYLRKNRPLSSLEEALQDVAEGRLYLDKEVEEKVFERLIQGDDIRSGFLVDLLTDREMEVFQMLGEGLNLEEIADELGVTEKTVETYRRRARQRLGLATTHQLLQFAIHWVATAEKC